MSQSLSKLYVHIVFHTKGDAMIEVKDEAELYSYMGGIVNQCQSQILSINGTANHIHLLCMMSKNIALAKLVEEIKRGSSRWIKSKGDNYAGFAWQGGYAGFSVSESKAETVRRYIDNQKQHHQETSAEEEYIWLLEQHKTEYDARYVWDK